MIREPKGPFGRMIESVYRKVSLFETDVDIVRNDTNMECFPYTKLEDIIHDNQNFQHLPNFLNKPVENFRNIADSLLKPLKDSLNGLRRQMVLDIGKQKNFLIFFQEIENTLSLL